MSNPVCGGLAACCGANFLIADRTSREFERIESAKTSLAAGAA
jgi:hypothetical protein